MISKKALCVLVICGIFTSILFSNASEKRIIIGYVPGYAVIEEPYIRGREGFGYEFFQEISKYTNHKYVFQPLAWSEGLEKLKTGEIDLLGPCSRIPEREEDYSFTKNSFGQEELQLVVPIDSDIRYGDIEAIGKNRIGYIEGDSTYADLQRFLEENEINPELVRVVENTMMEDFENDLYDIRVVTSLYSKYDVKVVQILDRTPFYFMSSKNNTNLTNEIDSAVEKIYNENYLFAEKLYLKYFTSTGLAKEALNFEDYESLQTKDVYRVGYNIGLHYISYNDENGNPKGYGVDVMNAIARLANIQIEYIPIDHKKNSSLNYTNTDFSLCVMSDCYSSHSNATDPYITVPLMAIKKKGIKNSDIETVACVAYNSVDTAGFSKKFPNASIVETYVTDDTYYFLVEGKVDAVVISSRMAMGMLTVLGTKNYVVEDMGVDVPFSILVSENLPNGILLAINKTISQIDKGYVESSIIENLNSAKGVDSVSDFFNTYKIHIVCFLLSLFFAAILTVMLLLNYRKGLLKKQLEYDSLTGFMTKYKFLNEVEKKLKNANSNEYIIFSIDIDNFKQINHVYGYEFGTKLLVQFANRIEKCYSGEVLVARDRGDVFVIFAENIFNGNTVCGRSLCTDCLVKDFVDEEGNEIKLSVSKGVYIIDNTFDSVDYMIDCANIARCRGKNISGSTIFEFDEK